MAFNNGNTAGDTPNSQQLAVHCKPSGSSTQGTAHLNCASPTKIGDDFVVNEPQCNFGRGPEECIPGNYVRTNDFPRIGMRRSNGHLYVAWQDFRNNEFDIQLARSLDGGATWSTSTTVNRTRNLDHYEPAVAVSPDGFGPDRVGVSYYRTGQVPNETTTPSGGFAPGDPDVQNRRSDYALAGGVACRHRLSRTRYRRCSRRRAAISSGSSAITAA